MNLSFFVSLSFYLSVFSSRRDISCTNEWREKEIATRGNSAMTHLNRLPDDTNVRDALHSIYTVIPRHSIRMREKILAIDISIDRWLMASMRVRSFPLLYNICCCSSYCRRLPVKSIPTDNYVDVIYIDCRVRPAKRITCCGSTTIRTS